MADQPDTEWPDDGRTEPCELARFEILGSSGVSGFAEDLSSG